MEPVSKRTTTAHQGTPVSLWGDTMTIKQRGHETNGALAMLEYVTAPGSGAALHTHTREDESFYVLEGSLSFQLAAQKIEVPAGSSIFIPRGVRHSFANNTNGPTRSIIIATPAGLEGFFEELGTLAQTHPLGLPREQFFDLARRYGVELF